ncbi:hypothetical protein SISNIDRAFT_450391 [Sistotremastrum niveocremeum HHB9708]|uniref:Protein kinase domain-containing protein n=1 Tax=Sistotremastrum niveocremeum HHB9708 TaxID=1314777 RepID=A0A164Y8G3_9AGAM|nr:hypothetical protein SISNIDRAFT_450391 [Sistotremastrum niveocremeum HHB9708]
MDGTKNTTTPLKGSVDRLGKTLEDTPRSAPTTGGVPSATERNESIEPVLRTELADGISIDAEDFFEKILHTDTYKDSQIAKCFAALVREKLYDEATQRFHKVPTSGHETQMYAPLIDILDSITKTAIDAKIPNVNDGIWKTVHRGIQGKDPNHQTIFPDIAGAQRIRGVAKEAFDAALQAVVEEVLSWQAIGNICEVKTSSKMDNHVDVHLQLAKYARKVLMYQRGRRRFILAWTLCGDIVRAWLFDRSGGLASKSFNYHEDPLLFIRMIISLSSLSSEDLGYDPTITETEDGKLILDFTYRDGDEFKTEKYVITESIVPRPSLRGRGTVVWRAYKLSDEDVPESERQYYAIKDSWRDLNREHDEGYFFERIAGLGPKDGVVKFLRFAAVEIGPTTLQKAPDEIATTVRQGVQGSRGSDFDHRGHVRLLMEEVGVTLDGFSSLRELIGVIMDAIKGHRNLKQRNILHRDVSFGNILMTEQVDPELRRRRGYLIDLDFAKDLASKAAIETRLPPPTASNVTSTGKKARVTGTLPFIAIDVLRGDENHRDVHDLESFFWVIVWMCLKYQGPNYNPVNLRAEPVDSYRFRVLEKMPRCKNLDDGGAYKSSVLSDCEDDTRLEEAFDPYFASVIPAIVDLAYILSTGRRVDQSVRNKRKTREVDERTHEKFLEVLDELYQTLPDEDEVHARLGTLIQSFAKLDLEEEDLHTPSQRSVGSFTSDAGFDSESRPATPTRTIFQGRRLRSGNPFAREDLEADTEAEAHQPTAPNRRTLRSDTLAARQAAQIPTTVQGGSESKTTKTRTKKR